MKYFLLGVFLLSSVAFLGNPVYLLLGTTMISFVIWLIISHNDILQILAFQKACLVMSIIVAIIIFGGAYEFHEKMNIWYVELYKIICLLFFITGYVFTSMKIKRINKSKDDEQSETM